MEYTVHFIQPVIALVVWSMVMWFWMYATRLPAITSMKMVLDPEAPTGSQWSQLPAKVRWKADNYNHLMEQPTLFYALALSLAILGPTSQSAIIAAWAYVGLRVIHSLIQVLTNKIEVRFIAFVLSNVPLVFLIYTAAVEAFKL